MALFHILLFMIFVSVIINVSIIPRLASMVPPNRHDAPPRQIDRTFFTLQNTTRSNNNNNNNNINTNNNDNNNNNDEGEKALFEKHVLCGGCLRSSNCGELILAKINKKRSINESSSSSSTMMVDAGTSREAEIAISDIDMQMGAELVFQQKKKKCARCSSSAAACSDDEKKYWRYPSKAVKIVHAQTHNYLSSVPSHHRVPESALRNDDTLNDYFSIPQDHEHPNREYFFDYNPSIVKLINPIIQQQQQQQQQAVYLSSYRVSTKQACFCRSSEHVKEAFNNRKAKHKNLLGLALLRRDLTIICDVVIKLPAQVFITKEDYRLHVLDNQIYVSTNFGITQLWVNESNPPPTDQIYNTAGTIIELQPIFDYTKISDHRSSTSNNNNKCMTIMVSSFDIKGSKNIKDKNLNYFVNHKNETMVEMQPVAENHIIKPVDLSIRVSKERLKYVGNTNDNNTIDKSIIYPSFATIDEMYYNKLGYAKNIFTSSRGSACCIRIPNPNMGSITTTTTSSSSKYLLVGISHIKTPYGRPNSHKSIHPNTYLSQFYAFEPISPYPIVAITGAFCFGYPQPSHEKNPLIQVSLLNMLVLSGETYHDCPRIHFVSGMTEKYEDDSKLIIAYGINDCYSRMIEVEKSDVIHLLFPN